jgi:hypothetical protein
MRVPDSSSISRRTKRVPMPFQDLGSLVRWAWLACGYDQADSLHGKVASRPAFDQLNSLVPVIRSS